MRITGSSSFPSSWGYSTYLLAGSRPVDRGSCGAGGPAGGYTKGCVPDWEVRANLSVSGTVWIQPGQQAVAALQLPVDWRRIPYEAEYMVGVRVTPLFNARAAPQGSQVGAAIYGTPPGHCPPGTAVRRDAPKRVADGPMYGATAALQELHFEVEGLGGAAAAAGGNSTSVLDLDPPFKPLTDRYEALLPHTARDAALVIGSTRDGDSITVDASGCNSLVSRDYGVAWKRGARVWRARYGLRAQRRPCWLRVHVFTAEAQQQAAADGGAGGGAQDDANGIPDALAPQEAAESDERTSLQQQAPVKAAPQPAVDEAGVRRVLYRTYTLRLVPLSPPQSLSLRSIVFANATATLVACGVPSRLAHLFVKPPQQPPRAPAAAADAKRSLPQPLVAAPNQRPLVAFYLNAPAARRSAANWQEGGLPLAPAATQALYSLFDRQTNTTVIWTQFTTAECAPDRFVLAPLSQVLILGGDARMKPELLDKTAQGVKIGMSGTALALSPDDDDADAPVGGPVVGGGNSSSLLGQMTGGLLAATLLQGADGNSSRLVGPTNGSSATNGSGSDGSLDIRRLGAPRLPGATLELPVITTADDGLSSKTYTLVLYSNISSAAALSKMQAAGNTTAAAADGDAAATSRRGGAAGSGSASEEEEEARLQRDVFGARPREWPRSPGQSTSCSLCAGGTYSTKLDAGECQVCPPGKFSPAYSAGCRLCPEGSFSYFWGADVCRTCLPGTFAPDRGSLYCNICPDGRTTLGEGASDCGVSVADLKTPEYVIMLSFGVVLSGASLGAVSRDTTGINGDSEGIVAVLVRSDTASALNVSLEAVTIGGVRQISQRRLLVNVSAAVPVNTEDVAVADTQDLSAGAGAWVWFGFRVWMSCDLEAGMDGRERGRVFLNPLLTAPHSPQTRKPHPHPLHPTRSTPIRRAHPAPDRGPQRLYAHHPDPGGRVRRHHGPHHPDPPQPPRRRRPQPARGAVADAAGGRAAGGDGRVRGAAVAAAAARAAVARGWGAGAVHAVGRRRRRLPALRPRTVRRRHRHGGRLQPGGGWLQPRPPARRRLVGPVAGRGGQPAAAAAAGRGPPAPGDGVFRPRRPRRHDRQLRRRLHHGHRRAHLGPLAARGQLRGHPARQAAAAPRGRRPVKLGQRGRPQRARNGGAQGT